MSKLNLNFHDDSGEWELWIEDFMIIGLGSTKVEALNDAMVELIAMRGECLRLRKLLKETEQPSVADASDQDGQI